MLSYNWRKPKFFQSSFHRVLIKKGVKPEYVDATFNPLFIEFSLSKLKVITKIFYFQSSFHRDLQKALETRIQYPRYFQSSFHRACNPCERCEDQLPPMLFQSSFHRANTLHTFTSFTLYLVSFNPLFIESS